MKTGVLLCPAEGLGTLNPTPTSVSSIPGLLIAGLEAGVADGVLPALPKLPGKRKGNLKEEFPASRPAADLVATHAHAVACPHGEAEPFVACARHRRPQVLCLPTLNSQELPANWYVKSFHPER